MIKEAALRAAGTATDTSCFLRLRFAQAKASTEIVPGSRKRLPSHGTTAAAMPATRVQRVLDRAAGMTHQVSTPNSRTPPGTSG